MHKNLGRLRFSDFRFPGPALISWPALMYSTKELLWTILMQPASFIACWSRGGAWCYVCLLTIGCVDGTIRLFILQGVIQDPRYGICCKRSDLRSNGYPTPI